MNRSTSTIATLLLLVGCGVERRPVEVDRTVEPPTSDGGVDAADAWGEVPQGPSMPEAGPPDTTPPAVDGPIIDATPVDVGGPADLAVAESGAPDVKPPATCNGTLTPGTVLVPPSVPNFGEAPLAVSLRGDILFVTAATGCEDPRARLARKTATGYDIHDLYNDPDFDGLVQDAGIFMPDGTSVAFLQKATRKLVVATINPDWNGITLVGEGPFARVNAALPGTTRPVLALSGDALSLAISVHEAKFEMYEARRAAIASEFDAPVLLQGDLLAKGESSDYWNVTALSHDGLLAFVTRDHRMYRFQRSSRLAEFMRVDVPPLVYVNSLRIAGQCEHMVGQYNGGGCQNGDLALVDLK